MEKICCKSCGGTLQKVGPVDFKCMFCGSMHQLDPDSESVRKLIELNNQRWLHINQQMGLFFDTVNRASDLKFLLKRPLLAILIVSGICGVALANLGLNLHRTLSQDFRGMTTSDLVPFLAVGGFLLVVAGYHGGVYWYGRWKMRKMMNEGRAIILDVLQTYRQMSEKPAEDMLRSLHNPKELRDDDALRMAFQVYHRAIGGLPGKGFEPETKKMSKPIIT